MSQAREKQNIYLSLLWRDRDAAAGGTTVAFSEHDDLRIKVVAEAIAPERVYLQSVLATLSTLLTDIATLNFRYEVLDDCLDQPDFTLGMAELLPLIRGLGETVSDIRASRHQVALVLSRLSELENYVECIGALDALLQRFLPRLKARGWQRLADHVRQSVQQPEFQQMAAELPELRASIRQIVSVTIGVNLSPDLKPWPPPCFR